jgi:hypothetical protein
MSHWNFGDDEEDSRINASNLTGKAFLVLDGDVKSKNRFKYIEKHLEESQYLVLKGKEIENLIPESSLKIVSNKYWEGFSFTDGVDFDIDKIKYEEYSTKDIGVGKYLEQFVENPKKIKDPKDRRRNIVRLYFMGKSGTIKMDKRKFCLDVIDTFSEKDFKLTNEIEELCEKIFMHIQKCNKDVI